MASYTGTGGNDSLTGTAGSDFFNLTASGQDTAYGRDGPDDFQLVGAGATVGSAAFYGEAGRDTFNILGPIGDGFSLTLDGGPDDDTFLLGGGRASVNGGDGADVVHLWTGSATATLGLGHDLAIIEYTASSLTIEDFTLAGDSSDRLDFSNYLAWHNSTQSWDGVQNPFAAGYVALVQSGADALIQLPTSGHATIITLKGVTASDLTATHLGGFDPAGGPTIGLTYTGGGGDDDIWGLAGDDVLTGGGGRDRLTGGAGSDRLYGGEGDDELIDDRGAAVEMWGGDGNDTLNFSRSNIPRPGTTALLNGGDGNDQITATITNNAYNGSITLQGEAGNDRLSAQGGAGGAVLQGGAGDDILIGGVGPDTLDGGDGQDTAAFVTATEGVRATLSGPIDTVVGTPTMDTFISIERLTGSRFNDALAGDAGANTLIGGEGDDQIFGRDGDDIIYGDDDGSELAGNDYLDGGNGIDTVSYWRARGAVVNLALTSVQNTVGGGNDTLLGFENVIGSFYADTITGNDGANVLIGGSGDDTLFGAGGDDLLNGESGMDYLDGGAGNDTASFSTAMNAVNLDLRVAGPQQADNNFDTLVSIENLIGTAFDDRLFGSNEVNILEGGNGADTLAGFDGDDVLKGGAGNDTLEGGAGADSLDGGDGNDTASYQNQTTGVYVTLSTAPPPTNVGTAEGDIFISIENLSGSGFADTLKGDSAANQIIGNAGNDILIGEAGDDTLLGGDGDDNLWGGLGSDILNGGQGIDTANYSDITTSVTPGSNQGVTVNLSVVTDQDTGAGGVDRFISIESVIGSQFNDLLIGNGGANVILGLFGDDVIEGGLGNDVLDGGTAGSDTVTYEHAGFAVNVNLAVTTAQSTGGAGTDTLANFENLTGSAFRDVLTGEQGSNTILGLAGDDTLDGGAGDDTLDGGAGTDTASYAGAASAVNVNLLKGTATGGAGNDTLLSIETVVGSAYGDSLVSGATGTVMRGMGGDDIFYFGDWIGAAETVTFDGGDGMDMVSYADSAVVVNANLADTRIDTSNNDADIISIEGLIGSAFGDSLTGNSDANVLIGGAGNDTLDGAGGSDRLYGGAGDDTFRVNTQGDLVFEFAGEGNDTVVTTADFYLYDNIETLTLASGAGNILGVGNSIANLITGNEGNNLLLGGAGNDTLNGGAGDDRLFGEAGADVLHGDAGSDQLVGGAGDDQLAGGDGADSLYGEDGNDVLVGGAGVDILIAGAGNDILDGATGDTTEQDLMDGGAADDHYLVDTADDLTFEAAGGGTDLVSADIAGGGYYLYANVENLLLAGTTAYGVGNELDNVITGNGSANLLIGGAGNDTLSGLGGHDILFGQEGADTFVFEPGTGGDVVGDFQAGVDKVRLTGLYGSFAEVQQHMVQNGSDTAILLDAGHLVVFQHVSMSAFTAGDFLLYP